MPYNKKLFRKFVDLHIQNPIKHQKIHITQIFVFSLELFLECQTGMHTIEI